MFDIVGDENRGTVGEQFVKGAGELHRIQDIAVEGTGALDRGTDFAVGNRAQLHGSEGEP
ncbi:hypothetical protein [Mesorhizobium sp. C277A]|uniref:hypothetical protein n=1 Tax=Mesorhizobium sp. C277A TaxID=2956827 RepID=UPI00333508C3